MRFRLYPTPAQEAMLLRHCSDAWFVWNLGLEQRNMWRRRFGPTPGFTAQSGQLTEARAEFDWLASGSQTVQQQALRDLDQAFRNWWSRPAHFGRPTWRRRGVHESFRIVGAQAARFERLSRKRARVLIPKVGWVDWRWSRNPGPIKSYRIRRDPAGRWWIGFAAKPEQIAAPSNGAIVGVDRGVTHAFVTSDGDMIDLPGLTATEQQRLLRLQRKLARQTKDSNRREATKCQIARLRHREINRRNDTIEKVTTDLARRYDTIRIEDLNIAAMTATARGTLKQPGTNVAAKIGLNRQILASGWGRFAQRLEDKIGNRLERIPAAYTSQRCHACGHTDSNNRQNQAAFECTSCGHSANADINAAQNTAAGCAVTARGDQPPGQSMKREPLAA